MSENTKSFRNSSPVLVVKRQRLDGAYFTNAVIVDGRAFTVGHIPTGKPFDVYDPHTGQTVTAEYAAVDHYLDVAVLDILCTGPGLETIDTPPVGSPVIVSWFHPTRTTLESITYRATVRGPFEVLGKDRVALDPSPFLARSEITCGAQVIDPETKKLIGIVNKAEFMGPPEAPITMILMVPVKEIQNTLETSYAIY